MKLGVMSAGVAALGWERALAFCQQLGLDAIELVCGAYTKTPIIDFTEVLASPTAQQRLKDDLARHGLTLSAIGCSGNGVHPDQHALNANIAARIDDNRRHPLVLRP